MTSNKATNATRVLVTGTTGFVGQKLVRQLTEMDNYFVRIVARSMSANLVQKQVEAFYIEDISETTFWADALRKCDVVIHVAARVHIMQEKTKDSLEKFRQVNVYGTMNLARQAAALGVKRFIFISSIKVNGEETPPGCPYGADDVALPLGPYATSKFEAEQQLQVLSLETGMQVVIIRPTIIYGPGMKGNFQRMMSWVQKGYLLPLKSINNKRSFVSIYNLVDLIIRCIDHPRAANQIFLVSDAEDVSIVELLQKIAKAMNKPVRLISIPHWVLSRMGKLAGYQVVVQRLCGSLQVDINKAYELLDWKPKVNMEEALRRTITQENS